MSINNHGINNPMFGKKHSEETKRKIAESRKKYTREKAATWKGGRRTNHSGYVEIFMPEHHRARANGYVFEHIIVAERKLGRRLQQNEQIHHIDHNKQNNDPNNLQALGSADHSRLHPRPRKGVTLNCELCGNEYYRKKSHVKKSKFCSKQCHGKYTMMIRYGGENIAK